MPVRALLGVLAVLLVAGCGAPSPTLTRLRSQATRICEAADRRTEVLSAPAGPTGGAAFLRSGLTVVVPELSELRALRSPSDTAAVYQAAIGDLGREIGAIRQALGAIAQGQDPAIAIRSLQRQLAPLESAQDGAWQALGVPACLTR